jgi:hypothetical protein
LVASFCWTREQRERMDEKFRQAFERALRLDGRRCSAARDRECDRGAWHGTTTMRPNSTTLRRAFVGFLAIFRGNAALVLTLKDVISQSRRAI